MKSLKSVAVFVGFGMIAALYWLVATGALGTGDQLNAGFPGQASGDRPSPSAVATGREGGVDADRQGAGAKAPQAANTSLDGADTGTSSAPARSSNAPPLVLVSPANIIPENVVTASGQGFQPGEQVDLTVAGVPKGAAITGPATVDKDGNFYGVGITVTVATPMGDYTVEAHGRKSGREAVAPLRVSGTTPYTSPSTYSGKGGTSVGFEGGGFKAGEVVSLHFDSLAVDPLQEVIANVDGSVAMSGTVPLADAGDHAFVLVGQQTNMPLRIPFSLVGFSPWVSPSDFSPKPQTMLGFIGHDFAPGEEVAFYREQLSDHPIAKTQADGNGEFTAPGLYEIPVDAEGKNVFVAMGLHSRSPVAFAVDVLPFSPVLELTVYAGQPGTEVAFKGSGYARGETITAYLGGGSDGREVGKFDTGTDGTFDGSGAFRIPPDVQAGNVTVTAVGDRSKAPLEVTFAVLPLTPWAGLTRYAGPIGTDFSFEGHGFLPGEMVTIHLGDRQSPALGTVKADENGSFQGGGTYTVPDDASGKITFLMVGETSEAEATAAFTVTEGPPEDEAAPVDENANPDSSPSGRNSPTGETGAGDANGASGENGPTGENGAGGENDATRGDGNENAAR